MTFRSRLVKNCWNSAKSLGTLKVMDERLFIVEIPKGALHNGVVKTIFVEFVLYKDGLTTGLVDPWVGELERNVDVGYFVNDRHVYCFVNDFLFK